ncbi:ABC transporter permease [Phycisphaera mikurensis]|uniref:Hypothetical membrane protein n=1 Tax=Phycisphaera mikurensis (strain NBRC 102666 / KCTC 22515 / FYK2301M01) TaxID=1142394 RepID=I0IEN6_PHYMF|nr:ABC transporter permease [Phycisphaera mikurensis]MBB6441522.1 hypothetical protein [Phycisphaera mikurensis]BAM03724.1 hypothetical membrane protein [Phycisphaera mikurensis NBRC 102666]
MTSPRLYLGILVGLLALFGAIAGWAYAGANVAAATGLAVVGNALVSAWLLYGLFAFRGIAWVAWLGRGVAVTLAVQALAAALWALGFEGAVRLVLGVWAMGAVFYVGLVLLRLALGRGGAVLAVGRTTLDEAIRQKAGLVFVCLALVLVPMLPLILSDTRLSYRVSNFLRYSSFVTGTLLSVMTLVLACRTVTRELDDRIAFTTLTKPLPRWKYLAGKWAGLMGLNALLVAVSGVGIYAFTAVLTADIPNQAMDRLDADAVTGQILVARVSAAPQMQSEEMFNAALSARLQELQERDPETFGEPGTGGAQLPPEVAGQVIAEVLGKWLAVPYRGSGTYRFEGLADAKERGGFAQLRLKPESRGAAPPDRKLQLNFRINGRPYRNPQTVGGVVPRLADDRYHVLEVPVEEIADDGSLTVTIENGGPGSNLGGMDQPTVAFNPSDGLQVFYRVGGFAQNLAAAMTLLWVRLGFLTALGLAAATFLGFPVAVLFCGLVFAAATGSGYLSESLASYAAFPTAGLPLWRQAIGFVELLYSKLAAGEVVDALKAIIRLVGELFAFFVPSLGGYNPTPLLADGQAITAELLGRAFFWVGLVWSGAVFLFGVLVFQRREIAQVTV